MKTKFTLKKLTLFLACCGPVFLFAQPTIQDCLGAIPVCQDLYSESESPSGDGNIGNEIINGETCTAGELNSIWYVFTANEDGQLGFLITPNNLDDDYDWALFDLTNGDCDDLVAENLVSCNAAGGTGCHGATGCSAGGTADWVPGGCTGSGPINALVPMQAGNTYVLMVSNWTGSPDGYTLDFSESTGLGIFDQNPPEVEDLTELPQDCDDSVINVSFNEFLVCSSVNDNAFSLDGPGGPYSLSVSSVACESGSNQAKSFNVSINPPIQSAGNFTFSIAPQTSADLLDLCDNQTEDFTFDFAVIPEMIPVNIGQDTSLLCEGDSLMIDASNTTGTSFVWEDGSVTPLRTITSAGIYSVTVTDGDCGFGTDEIEVVVQQEPPSVDFGGDQLICPGDVSILDADNGLAFYTWQDGSSSTTYTVTTTGDYAVTVENGCGIVTEDINITVVSPLNLNLASEYVLCLGDTLEIDIERPFATYQWADGSTLAQRTITADDDFAVTVTTLCETYEAAFSAFFLVDPMLELGDDLVLCPNDTLALEPNIPGASYVWQDGSTGDRFLVTSPDTYRVSITTACNELVDSVVIDFLLPITTELGRDTFLCPDENFPLNATSQGIVDYQWENGDKEPRRRVTGPGDYSITVTSACETVVDTIQIVECEICNVYMPNAFTPDNDGVNDRLFPQSPCLLEAYEMQIFDRWGSQLYSTTDPFAGWDGTINGQLAKPGTYVWVLNYVVLENDLPRAVTEGGDVVLLR